MSSAGGDTGLAKFPQAQRRYNACRGKKKKEKKTQARDGIGVSQQGMGHRLMLWSGFRQDRVLLTLDSY